MIDYTLITMKRLIIILFAMNLNLWANSPLTFHPQFRSQYYSSGSIHHFLESGSTTLHLIGLGATKSQGPFSISGIFNFTTAHNLDVQSTFFNPDLNIEMKRGYIENDDTWFESSNLKIDYNQPTFSASFGKYTQSWGHGNSSLILSNNSPSFPQGGFSWRMSNTLKLEYFLGSLSSQMVDSSSNELYDNVGHRNTYYARSIAGHRFSWTPHPSLTFNAMETVIFGDRSIDVHYLLPFVPFWSMQHYTGDIDNVQMCGELVWQMNNNWTIYGSLFVDEWRPEWTFNEKNRNWFGYQIGGISHDLIKTNDQFQIEYTWTDHRIYRHRFPINDAYSFGYSLGFWAGPHAEELFLSYKFNLKSINISSYISSVKRGELTEQMLSDQYDDVKYERYFGETESRLIASVIGEKRILKDNFNIKVGVEWIDWENPGFKPTYLTHSGTTLSKLSFLFGISAKKDISFD